VTVTETNAAGCVGLPFSQAVTVNAPPATSAINGSSSVLANATGVAYSVSSTSGSSYGWTVPAGASVASGQGTASITVDFGNSGGNVGVTETNASGCVGMPVSETVAVYLAPVIHSPAISNGTFQFQVSGSTGLQYTVYGSTNLANWDALLTTNPLFLPFQFLDTIATNFDQRSYRVLMEP
jgi:hypothetical protein